jgi:hypothetical protein
VLLSSAGSPLTPRPTPATSTSRPPSNPTETRGFGGDPGKASGRNARVVTAGFVDIVSFDKLASVCSEYLTRAREVAWSASSGCPSGPAGTASSAPESRSSPTPPVPQRRRDHEEVVVAVRRKIAGHRPGSVGVARRRHLGHEAAGGRSVQDRSSSTRPGSRSWSRRSSGCATAPTWWCPPPAHGWQGPPHRRPRGVITIEE